LRGIELAVLQATAVWRERQAMARDRPRRKILPDDILIQIAVNQPKNTSELKRTSRIGKLLCMSELDSLSEAIGFAYSLTEAEWPTLKRRQLTQQQSAALTAVLDHLRKKASTLRISTSMLCNRKDAEKLILGRRNLRVLEGWRLDCVGKNLLKMVPPPPEG
jgi:ribonuclease D